MTLRSPRPLLIALIAAVASFVPPGAAAPLFEVNATTTDVGTPLTIQMGSSKLLDFFQQIVDREAEFTGLDFRDYRAAFKFFGVSNALLLTENRTGTAVTFDFRPIGVQRTFQGANEDDVYDQIEKFFLSDGQDVLARFWKALSEQSSVAVNDGNPKSATAGAAMAAFQSEGFTSVAELGLDVGDQGSGSVAPRPRFSGFGIGFNSGKFEAGPFTGTFQEFSMDKTFGRWVRLSLAGSLIKVEGASIYGSAATLSSPIWLSRMSEARKFNWRLTPLIGVGIRGSADLANGAAIWHAGVVNTIDYRVSKTFVVCFVNQFTTHKSISIPAGEVDYDPQIDQQIVKNGLRLVHPLGRRVIADVFAVDSRFLKAAAVRSFQSFGGSLSLRATQSMNLSLGANYDTGRAFKSYSVGLSSAWKW